MRLLHVLPTAERVFETQASLFEGAATLFGTRAMTIEALEQLLTSSALAGRRRLPPGARDLALRSILADHEQHSAFRSVVRKPGFRRAVEAFLVELAGGGATPEQMEAASEKLPGWQRSRIVGLARIARDYQRFLGHRELDDAELSAPRIVQALERGGQLPAPLRDVEQIEFRDIVDWSPARLGLVRSLATALRAHGVHVVLELPQSDHPVIADSLDPAYRAVEAMAGDVELRPRPIRGGAGQRLSAFDAATASAEAREVAHRIAQLLREGAPAGSIVVAAQEMRDLAPELGAALRRVGVPTRNRCGTLVTQTVTYRLARDLATMDEHDAVTRERVAAILGSSVVDLTTMEPRAPAPQTMARHLRAAAVRSRIADSGGEDGFLSRLARLAAAQRRMGHQKDASLVPHTSATVRRLFERLDAWPQSTTWITHGMTLLGLLTELRVPELLQQNGFSSEPLPSARPSLSDAAQARALAHEQAAWTRLREAIAQLEDAVDALQLPAQRVTRAEFVAWLDRHCAEEAIGVEAANGAAVELVELSDLSGRRVEHLFLVGAYDGRLPESAEPDPLLADDERWQLNGALGRPVFRVSPSTTSASVLQARQLLQTLSLALAVECASESVTLSRPRMDNRGRQIAPSALIGVVAPDVTVQHVPFASLDPRLAARMTTSIQERREAARERIAVFQGKQPPGRYSGNVTALTEVLTRVSPGTVDRPWSASALERVATCGFRYLAEWMWKAHEEDEPVEQIGVMETGRLAHLAAEFAVREIVNRDLWHPTHLTEALEVGIEAASGALEKQEPATVLGHPDLWAVTRERMMARLRRLLEIEVRYTHSIGVRPAAYELSFGLPQAALPAVELGGVFVAGQVDRVDVGPGTVTILDYKSGKTEANARKYEDDVLLETQFQLPLYVSALSRVMPEAKGRVVDAGYVSLRDAQRTVPLSDVLQSRRIPDVTVALEKSLRDLSGRVRGGHFAIEPHSCGGCHLRPVCRIPRPEDRS
jgi:hypothetical protein